MSLFSNLLNVPKLQKRIQDLEAENQRLRDKLNQKQQQINKTNAYYKGLLRKKNTKAANS